MYEVTGCWFNNPSHDFHDKWLTFLINLSLPVVRDVYHREFNILFCFMHPASRILVSECVSHF